MTTPLAKRRAQGLIGAGKVAKLYDAALVVVFAAELARLQQRIAQLEQEVKMLRQAAAESREI